MLSLSRDHLFYAFGETLQPALEVDSGTEIIIETHDCFCGQIQKPSDTIDALNWNRVNPATGPVAVRGARPGDTLAVDILDIHVGEQGTMVAIPDAGALGDVITQSETRIIPIRSGMAEFSESLHLPLQPMIGVIGTVPLGNPVPNGTPGPHGGNMDCTLVAAGATLYLPVQHPGALLGLGDMHAVMGDGEIVVCGVEAPGEARLRVRNLGPTDLPLPFLENEELVAAIYSAPTLDEASQGAIHRMANFLMGIAGIPLNEAGMLLSIAGNLKVCQVVDPLKTMRMELPKAILQRYGFSLSKFLEAG
ncbi:MAG: acetamidase/formamidase family protein [Chloroflexi bacterium]|nr:acetamidase/formamidase family protein [Chloroflexota bacterium]